MTRICNQGNIYNQQKHLLSSTYKTGPHADTHTKRKETQSSFLDPPTDERETSWGSEFVAYLVVGGKACSMVRHLPKVVGLVTVAGGGLVVCGGARVVNSRGPRREVGVALPFLVEAQQRRVHRLDDPLLNPRDSKNQLRTCNSPS